MRFSIWLDSFSSAWLSCHSRCKKSSAGLSGKSGADVGLRAGTSAGGEPFVGDLAKDPAEGLPEELGEAFDRDFFASGAEDFDRGFAWVMVLLDFVAAQRAW
jgi:hypothetical protein